MAGVVGAINAPLPPLILEGELVTPAAPRRNVLLRDEGEFVTPAAPRDEGEFVSSTTLSIFYDSIINNFANNSAKSKRSLLKPEQSAI